jgi:cellulose synthase/poly-beta-1,6-N-acetylglucosamine synthase-like glycosyltransferase
VSADYLPTVSVLIAARNEEKDIGWKITETLNWDYPADRLKVLIASDASEDLTDAIVSQLSSDRVRLVRMHNRGGKGRALNQLAKMAQGELLFFTDANAHIEPHCLRLMVRHFSDGRVGCVTGNSQSSDIAEQQDGAALYWGHELFIRAMENLLGSVLVCDGAIFMIRHELYEAGDPALANDLELPLRIGNRGYWLLHESRARVVEKDTNSVSEEFSRRRRICAQGALGAWKLRSVLRGLRAWQFISHKCLRWLTAIPMVLLLVSAAALYRTPLAGVMFAGQLAFYTAAVIGLLINLVGKLPGKLLSIPMYVVVSAAGAFMGVVDACTGRRFDVWQSPTLSRGSEAMLAQDVGPQ